MIYENNNFLIPTSKNLIRNPKVGELVIYEHSKFPEKYLYFPSSIEYSPLLELGLQMVLYKT